MKSSPSRAARVVSAAASDPEPGSVRETEKCALPSMSGGRERVFWAAVPCLSTASPPITASPTAEASSNSASASSSSMTIRSSMLPSAPPYSAGKASPSHPSAAISSQTSSGNTSCSSHSRIFSGGQRRASTLRTVRLRAS